jgi:hypothetical protein
MYQLPITGCVERAKSLWRQIDARKRAIAAQTDEIEALENASG